MNLTATLQRGEDNAPLTGTYVIGSNDDRVSDPTNLDFDKGVTPFNQTHTLAISTVYAPRVSGDGIGAYLANNNQLGVVVQANGAALAAVGAQGGEGVDQGHVGLHLNAISLLSGLNRRKTV